MNPPADNHVTAIAAGSDYGLALTSHGSVLAWGENDQVGDGIVSEREAGAVQIPPITVDLPTGTHATAISAGDSGGLVLTSHGTVWTWGDTLGNGYADSDNILVQVDLPAGTHVAAVAAGDAPWLADRRVWC